MLKSLVYPEKEFCISVLRHAQANIAICCPLVNQNVTVMIYHKCIRQFKVNYVNSNLSFSVFRFFSLFLCVRNAFTFESWSVWWYNDDYVHCKYLFFYI